MCSKNPFFIPILPFHQGALQTAQAESEHWRRLCEELKEGSSQLKKRQDECTDQLLQLQGHLEVHQSHCHRNHHESIKGLG